MAAALEIAGLTLHFGGVTALADVSLSLAPGHVLGLAGPNGSGKSSLLNVLTGHYPASGTIRLDGAAIDGLGPASRARLGITRSFQTPRVYRRMTVHENLAAARHALRPLIQSAAARRREAALISDSLHCFGLAAHAGVTPDRLTPFQLRLLELARAQVARARLVLLDEPAAGATRSEAEMLTRVMARHLIPGRTVLVVEHRLEVLRALCTDLAVFEAGRLVARGPCAAELDRPGTRALLMGERVDA